MMWGKYQRRQSRQLKVGKVAIGGDAPIVVQSMNNVPSWDVEANLAQIGRLAAAGCELTRIAVPDEAAAAALAKIKERSQLPIVADIHFNAKLALLALEAGADALRINPGNIRDTEGLKAIAKAARQRGIPIRVGVNSGSLSPAIRDRFGGVNAEALAAQTLEACALLEKEDFNDICLSMKASEPLLCIETYRLLAEARDYPFHLGVTEAGTEKEGVVRSAVGIGTLLAEGIGDTIRVSLTAEPEKEVVAAYQILKALNLRQYGVRLISCPTCGRTEVALEKLAKAVEERLAGISEPIRVAVMGCPVNGPGEARAADCGIAGGRGEFLIFRKGEVLRKVAESEALAALEEEIEVARKAYREEHHGEKLG